jgi:hypothetical protein
MKKWQMNEIRALFCLVFMNILHGFPSVAFGVAAIIALIVSFGQECQDRRGI